MPRRFENWAGTHRASPTTVHAPETEAEVQRIVAEAYAAGRAVKVVGSAHSWSAIAVPVDEMVRLDRMDRVLEVDPRRGIVRVEPGLRLHALIRTLRRHGLSLRSVGSIAEQTVGGALATATHGSSLSHGNLSTLLVGCRLVTGTGEVRVVDASDPVLPAVRVGLGALGILTEVTLRCVPLFSLEETSWPIRWDDAVRTAVSLAQEHEYLKLWWLPHSRRVQVYAYRPSTAAPTTTRLGRVLDRLVNLVVFPLLIKLAAFFPVIVPRLNRLVARSYFQERRRVGPMEKVLTVPMPPRHREVEYAVPLERTAEALTALRAIVDEDALRVNFIAEVRFVKGDDAWMSPAYGGDVCHLGAYMAQAPGIDRYFERFEEAMLALGGRPHWGKELTPTRDDLLSRYPKSEAFVALARELDPKRVFVNPYLERFLGL